MDTEALIATALHALLKLREARKLELAGQQEAADDCKADAATHSFEVWRQIDPTGEFVDVESV